MDIQIKPKFSEWKDIDRPEALEYARWKFRNIHMGEDKEEYLLEIINKQFRGIQFNLKDLK